MRSLLNSTTTLVAMGATLPSAIGFGIGSEMRQPLRMAIVGGLLVSQLLPLLSAPAIYLGNYDREEHKAARKARLEATRSRKARTAGGMTGFASSPLRATRR